MAPNVLLPQAHTAFKQRDGRAALRPCRYTRAECAGRCAFARLRRGFPQRAPIIPPPSMRRRATRPDRGRQQRGLAEGEIAGHPESEPFREGAARDLGVVQSVARRAAGTSTRGVTRRGVRRSLDTTLPFCASATHGAASGEARVRRPARGIA